MAAEKARGPGDQRRPIAPERRVHQTFHGASPESQSSSSRSSIRCAARRASSGGIPPLLQRDLPPFAPPEQASPIVQACRMAPWPTVTSALDFPSMEYIWEAQRVLGAKVEIVGSPEGITVPLENILAAIDDTTSLVAMSHTSFRSSYRVDANAIVERAHSVGALVLLDVYQSAGSIELDASIWGVDFLIGGTIKWLCGGPACGYLYVRPDLQRDLKPRLTGWVAHDVPFEFAHAPMRYARSVRRFAQGTPSIPALYSALPGLQILEEVGVETIARESRRRTEWMVEFALERGWKINSPRDVNERGPSVMIDVADGSAMVDRLAKRKVFVDCRPGVGLRISPHFFNTDEEVHEARATIAQEALLVERQLPRKVLVVIVRGLVGEDPSELLPPGLVQAGQEVKKGHTLGRVGSTGRATGPHLFFGVRWHDSRIDPKFLLEDPGKIPAVNRVSP